MKKRSRFCALVFVFIFFISSCQTVPKELLPASTAITPVPEPYTKDEFPVWARDLHRAEIITFGSIPFTVLLTTLGYGFFRFFNSGFNASTLINPLATGSGNLTMNEQIGIIATAAGISVGLGLTDFIISLVKRKTAEKIQKQKNRDGSVITIEQVKPVEPLPPVARPLIEPDGKTDAAN